MKEDAYFTSTSPITTNQCLMFNPYFMGIGVSSSGLITIWHFVRAKTSNKVSSSMPVWKVIRWSISKAKDIFWRNLLRISIWDWNGDCKKVALGSILTCQCKLCEVPCIFAFNKIPCASKLSHFVGLYLFSTNQSAINWLIRHWTMARRYGC